MNYQEKLDELSNTETAITWLNQMRKQSTKDYDPLVTYLFINKDLQMSAGKLAVQCARAGQYMLYNELKQANSPAEQSLLELTQDTFMRGNKTIGLRSNESKLHRLLFGDLHMQLDKINQDNQMNITLYPVFDIGVTEVKPNSLTVVAMSPAPKSILTPIAKRFQLY